MPHPTCAADNKKDTPGFTINALNAFITVDLTHDTEKTFATTDRWEENLLFSERPDYFGG